MTTKYPSKILVNLFRFHRSLSTSSSTQSQKLIVKTQGFSHQHHRQVLIHLHHHQKEEGVYSEQITPHIDKKSREQFEMRIKSQYHVVKVYHQVNYSFWLKRQRLSGAQFELQFNTKTRLDLKRVSPRIPFYYFIFINLICCYCFVFFSFT
ncbi:hypothetical protein MKW92_048992 [Papaver armeniacum]|nr:hypothetical protein MKW92_048992 [Papaver armeniacum]